MRLVQPSGGPTYCSECDATNAYRVRFQNPGVVQNGGFALCLKHADQLASLLLQKVREAQYRHPVAADKKSHLRDSHS
jgi:hypothetical protein